MKKILFILPLFLLMSCAKEDTAIDSKYFVGTWTNQQPESSFQITISAGPTATSFEEIPDPAHTGYKRFTIRISRLEENKLFFICIYSTQVGDSIRECTCNLESKDKLKVVQVRKVGSEIRGSAVLTYVRKK